MTPVVWAAAPLTGLPMVGVTVALIALSGFFVATEFSLIAAKRHRIEEAALTSGAARAALRNASELTLLLAGAQLGITLCTLALGAITKPAVHEWLTPLVAATGLPPAVASGASFVAALLIVTFLHLVVGEMAPKSWAIAHPERSAIWLARPMRAFMALNRPALRAMNAAANWMLARRGITPVDELAEAQDPDGLRQLVQHSVNVGALDLRLLTPITTALDLSELTLADLLPSGKHPRVLPPTVSVAEVQAETLRSRHLRVLLGTPARITGVVHVRDTLGCADDASAAELAREPFELAAETPLHEALKAMREGSQQLAVVRRADQSVGVITLADLLPRLFPSGSQPEGN